jgi:predicted membrane metal-binding protein
MKTPLIVVFVEIIAAVVAVLSSLASAITYEPVFILGLVAGIIAVGCVTYLYFVNLNWFLWGLIPAILGIYAMSDVILRYSIGVRVLEIFS